MTHSDDEESVDIRTMTVTTVVQRITLSESHDVDFPRIAHLRRFLAAVDEAGLDENTPVRAELLEVGGTLSASESRTSDDQAYADRPRGRADAHVELDLARANDGSVEAEFSCEQCGASFARAQALGSHRAAKHPDPRGFACPDCDRRFATSAGLGGHRRTHTQPSRPAHYAQPIRRNPLAIDRESQAARINGITRPMAPVAVRRQPFAPNGVASPAATRRSGAHHLMVAICVCGHPQRRHEEGVCTAADCRCTSYQGAGAGAGAA